MRGALGRAEGDDQGGTRATLPQKVDIAPIDVIAAQPHGSDRVEPFAVRQRSEHLPKERRHRSVDGYPSRADLPDQVGRLQRAWRQDVKSRPIDKLADRDPNPSDPA